MNNLQNCFPTPKLRSDLGSTYIVEDRIGELLLAQQAWAAVGRQPQPEWAEELKELRKLQNIEIA